jgi:hypothetical protein
LDNYVEDPRCETERVAAVNLLRQAIAEAEKPWVKTYCGGKPNYTTPEQEPVAWREVAGKTTHYYDYNEDGRGEPLYAAPVHVSDISQERVDETAKDRHDIVGSCVTCGAPHGFWLSAPPTDFISPSVVKAISKREWAGQPDLARVGEVGVWGGEKNT